MNLSDNHNNPGNKASRPTTVPGGRAASSARTQRSFRQEPRVRGLCRLPYSRQLPGRLWASRGEPGVTPPHLGRPGPARGCCLLGWGPAFSASDVPPVRCLRGCPGWGGAGRSLAPRGGSAGIRSHVLTQAAGEPCLGPGRLWATPSQRLSPAPGGWRGQAACQLKPKARAWSLPARQQHCQCGLRSHRGCSPGATAPLAGSWVAPERAGALSRPLR